MTGRCNSRRRAGSRTVQDEGLHVIGFGLLAGSGGGGGRDKRSTAMRRRDEGGWGAGGTLLGGHIGLNAIGAERILSRLLCLC